MACKQKDTCIYYEQYDQCSDCEMDICEMFYELTEAEKLRNKLNETIEQLTEAKYPILLERIKNYESQVQELNKCLHNAHKVNTELEKQIPNVDQLRKECLQEVRKEVLGPLTVGQEIFIVKSDNNRTTCPECKGTGKLKHSLSTNEEVKVDCPKCHYGKVDNYVYWPKKATIHSIVLTTWKNSDTREIVVKVEYYLDGYDYKKELKELFATEEECQAHIDSQVKQ